MTNAIGTFATATLPASAREALAAYVERVGYKRAGERLRCSSVAIRSMVGGLRITPATAERISRALAAIDPLDPKDEDAVERMDRHRERARLRIVAGTACSLCGASEGGGPSTCWACKNAIPASDDPRWPLWDAALTRSPMLCLAWSKAKVRNLGWWREARAADVPLRVEDFARRNGDTLGSFSSGQVARKAAGP